MSRPRDELAREIGPRPRVTWWVGVILAVGFAALVLPAITTERWLGSLGKKFVEGRPAPYTLRVPPFAGYEVDNAHVGGGGIIVARGSIVSDKDAENAARVDAATPRGALPYVSLFFLVFVFAAIFTHHTRRSNVGRLLRVQLVSLGLIAFVAWVVKIAMLATPMSMLVVPLALFAMVPTIALDRVVGLATGVIAALVIALVGPFDVGISVLMLVQTSVAGLVIAERPKGRWRAAVVAGLASTICTALTYPLLLYFTTGHTPFNELHDPLRSTWLAAAIGPALATVLAVPLLPIYQRLVGEITTGKLIELDDLSHPLLRQIAERAPGTWQHSLMMANLADIAANEIGANARLVRVGAYFHDLGKSLQPKYFIENLEPGEPSPHDQLPPEVSCDAIFAHVTEGIVTARNAGLHERIVDFMHMHHGNGILEYFWGKTREQGNPKELSIDYFRYPGVPPQSRETAILAICDAVEAASRTLKKPDAASIDSLVQRIVYGKLHLGQLDESGLSMSDLRRVVDSLRDTIRHANHGRIEYPWQKDEQNTTAQLVALSASSPRLDSLDRQPRADSVQVVAARGRDIATADTHETPNPGTSGATPHTSLHGKQKATIVEHPSTSERRAFSLDDPSTSERRAFALDETAPINEDMITAPQLPIAEAPRRQSDGVPRSTLLGSAAVPARTPAGRPVPEGVPDALLAGPGSSPLRLPPTLDPGARATAVGRPDEGTASSAVKAATLEGSGPAVRPPPAMDPAARATMQGRPEAPLTLDDATTSPRLFELRTPPGMDPGRSTMTGAPSGPRPLSGIDPAARATMLGAPPGPMGARTTTPQAHSATPTPRTTTGERPIVPPTGQRPARTTTGERPIVPPPTVPRTPTGQQPIVPPPTVARTSTGERPIVPPSTGPSLNRMPIQPARTTTGERPIVAQPTAARTATGERPIVSPAISPTAPSAARTPSGPIPSVPRAAIAEAAPKAPLQGTSSSALRAPPTTDPGVRAGAAASDAIPPSTLKGNTSSPLRTPASGASRPSGPRIERDERSVVSAMPPVPEEAREPLDPSDSAPIIYDRKPTLERETPPAPFRPLAGEPMRAPMHLPGEPVRSSAPTHLPGEPIRSSASTHLPGEPILSSAPMHLPAEPRAGTPTPLPGEPTRHAEPNRPPPTTRPGVPAAPIEDRSSPWSTSPPPPPVSELDTASTIPPPLRRLRNSPAAARAQALVVDDEPTPASSLRITAERPIADDVTVRRTAAPPTTLAGHAAGPFDASPFDDDDEPAPPPQPRRRATTASVIRREDMAPKHTAPMNLPDKPWAAGLAARIDAALDDDFGGETPVMAPTKEELAALLGAPEPTRQVPFEEIEALRHASEDSPSEPELEILRPRKPLTEEILPEDIESAIEIAPPARRAPNIIAVAKKKKPE